MMKNAMKEKLASTVQPFVISSVLSRIRRFNLYLRRMMKTRERSDLEITMATSEDEKNAMAMNVPMSTVSMKYDEYVEMRNIFFARLSEEQ